MYMYLHSTYSTELQEAACFSPKGLQPSCYGLMLLQPRNNGVIDNLPFSDDESSTADISISIAYVLKQPGQASKIIQ